MNAPILKLARAILSCGLGSLLAVSVGWAQPANDNFAGSLPITGATGMTTGSNDGATKETGEPQHAGNAGGRSVWWHWVAPFNGRAVFRTAGSNFDTLLAIYRGTSVAALTPVASNDDAGYDSLPPAERSPQSEVRFNVAAGTTYRIVVDGFAGAAGSIELYWEQAKTRVKVLSEGYRITGSVEDPAEEDVFASFFREGAEPLFDSFSYQGASAANGAGPFGISTTLYGTPLDGPVTSASAEATWTLQVLDYGDSEMLIEYGGFTAYEDDVDESAMTVIVKRNGVLWDQATFPVTASSEPQIWGTFLLGNGMGDVWELTLRITEAAWLSDFVEARIYAHLDPAPFDPEVSIAVSGDAAEGAAGTFTLSRNGPTDGPLTVNIEVSGSATAGVDYAALSPTVTFAPGSATATQSVVPINDSLREGPETVIATVTAGSGYVVRFPSYWASMTLADDDWGVAPENDDLDQAISLNISGTTTGDNLGATREEDEPEHGGPGGKSVWWEWFAETSGEMSFDTAGSDFDTLLAVYQRIPGGGLAYVGSNDDALGLQSRVRFWADSPGSYVIAVDGFNGASGSIRLNWSYETTPIHTLAINNYAAGEIADFGSSTVFASFDRAGPGPLHEVASAESSVVECHATGSSVQMILWSDSELDRTLHGIASSTMTFRIPTEGESILWVKYFEDHGPYEFESGGEAHLHFALRRNGILWREHTEEWSPPIEPYAAWSAEISGNNKNVDIWELTISIEGDAQSGGGGVGVSAQVEISEAGNLPMVSVTAADSAAAEPGDSGTFTFSRTGPAGNALTVYYILSGTATSGVDFTALGTSVTFPAGSTTVTKTVTPLDDALFEGPESVVLTILGNVAYLAGAEWSGTVTIADNELPTVTVVASDASAGEPSNPGTLTFSRTGPTSASLTANITVTGTATSGIDYNAIGSTVTFAAGSATAAKTVTPIDDVTVEASETVIVALAAGAGYIVGSPASGTVTIADNDSAAEDLLVDNSDGPAQVIIVGSWPTSTSAPGFFGANYLHDENAGKGSKSVTYIPTIGTAGAYQVSLWYTAQPNRASNVPVDILHSGGTTTVTLNQRINGSQWVSLGAFSFPAGTAGRVVIRTTGTDGYVIADAIRLTAIPVVTVAATDPAAGEPSDSGSFTFSRTGPTTSALTVNFTVSGSATSGADYSSLGTSVGFLAGSATAIKSVTPMDDLLVEGPETVVVTIAAGSGYVAGTPASASVTIADNESLTADLLVDNADGPAQVVVEGSWTTATTASGYWGVNYLHDGNTGKGAKSVTLIPTVGVSGAYQVAIWYTAHANRASNVPVDVIHAGGTSTVLLNQRLNGSQWVSLGNYNFVPGTAGQVRIRTTDTDGYVIVDAIQLTAVSPLTELVPPKLIIRPTPDGARLATGDLETRPPRSAWTRYQLESSADLRVWSPLQILTLASPGNEFEIPPTESAQQFYRLIPLSDDE